MFIQPTRSAHSAMAPHRGQVRAWLRAAAVGILLATGLDMAVQARTLTMCVSQNPLPPLTYPDHEGTAQVLVRRAVEQQGDTVNFVAAPWIRCRIGLKNGDYAAALPLAPAAENLVNFALPVKKGMVDPSRSVGDFTIRVLRRRGTRVGWDGMAFSYLSTPVMALPAQVIVRDKLKTLGTPEDAGTPYAESILRKLAMGRRDVAVLPDGFVRQAMASGEFRDAVEVLPQPLMSGPSFVGFNRDFQRRQPAYVEAVWAGIGQLRGSSGGASAAVPFRK